MNIGYPCINAFLRVFEDAHWHPWCVMVYDADSILAYERSIDAFDTQTLKYNEFLAMCDHIIEMALLGDNYTDT